MERLREQPAAASVDVSPVQPTPMQDVVVLPSSVPQPAPPTPAASPSPVEPPAAPQIPEPATTGPVPSAYSSPRTECARCRPGSARTAFSCRQRKARCSRRSLGPESEDQQRQRGHRNPAVTGGCGIGIGGVVAGGVVTAILPGNPKSWDGTRPVRRASAGVSWWGSDGHGTAQSSVDGGTPGCGGMPEQTAHGVGLSRSVATWPFPSELDKIDMAITASGQSQHTPLFAGQCLQAAPPR